MTIDVLYTDICIYNNPLSISYPHISTRKSCADKYCAILKKVTYNKYANNGQYVFKFQNFIFLSNEYPN